MHALKIPDDAQPGSYILGVSAADADTGLNGKIRFYLSGPDAKKFQINENTGVVKSLRRFGKGRKFQFDVNAVDSSIESPMSASLSVALELAHPDRFPKIKRSVRSFTFPENQGNQMVTNLEGEERTGTNYLFTIGGGNLGHAFQVDRHTGVVKLSSNGLDYETAVSYELWIEMAAEHQPKLRTAVSLIVNVTDVNDNGPVFERNVYNFSVMEEEYGRKIVGSVLALDEDSGVNAQLEYSLSAESEKLYGNIFIVDPNSGQIVTKTKLDREEQEMYGLIVEARDKGTPSKTGSTSVLVTVDDKNDNPPRFTRLFSVNVTENVAIGTFVIQVTSVDKDVGENANCTYSFTDNTDGKFKIDPFSGNVTVSGMLDRESQDEYLLKVSAIDGSWRAETLVTVTIQDVNDNAPLFEYSYYNFNIPESEDHPVTFVGKVSSQDRDKRGPNSVISYSLKQPSDFFSVDPVSGEIFSKRPLKYKHSRKSFSPENAYELTVTAVDSGKPPLSSECTISINVVSGNNHAPRFSERSYFSPVLDTFTQGDRIIQVTASDENDVGVNAELEYFAIGGNGSELFGVEKETGWIRLNGPVGPSHKDKWFNLELRVLDKGIPPQLDEVSATLVVTGENLHGPVFSALSYRVIVPENEALDTVIVTVAASDKDEGPNGAIVYEIMGGNEQAKFAIERNTGAVRINKELDYDSTKEYQLRISARDLAYKSRTAQAELTVILTDVNDNAPYFVLRYVHMVTFLVN